MVTIRAHYDGKVIVPEEAVELPMNETLELQVVRTAEQSINKNSDLLPEAEREKRKAAFERFLARSIHVPDIPLEALRRENLYEDRL